jgi:hypothetical protein
MNLRVIAIGLLIGCAYVLFWCGLSIVLARLTGWTALARRYQASDGVAGRRWHFQHANFRWCLSYSGALTVEANSRGLSISIWPIFRAGHPTLSIPWTAMRIEMRRSFWLGEYMELQFQELPGVYIRFSRRLARRIAETIGPELAAGQEHPHASAV